MSVHKEYASMERKNKQNLIQIHNRTAKQALLNYKIKVEEEKDNNIAFLLQIMSFSRKVGSSLSLCEFHEMLKNVSSESRINMLYNVYENSRYFYVGAGRRMIKKESEHLTLVQLMEKYLLDEEVKAVCKYIRKELKYNELYH